VRRRSRFTWTFTLVTLGAVAVSAFDVPTHRSITLNELKTLTATVGGKTVKFSQRALEEIAQANEDTDDLSSAALFHPERHFTNERFLDGTTELVTLRQRVISSVTGSPADGSAARKALGRALHAIQDFYSHSNWIEQGKGSPVALFGTGRAANPPAGLAACPVDGNNLGPSGGGGDTSGYYIGLLGCGPIPAGKCWHGNYSSWCPGINKDKPGFAGHGAARGVAEQATTNFVQGIIDTLAGKDKALMALLDVRGTTAFIIDDTGSMGGTIDGVKSIVGQIVTTLNNDPDLKPTNWLLERFNDPDYGPPLVTDEASVLLGGVNALSAHGGGDCPELSQSGLLEAIDGSLPNSMLYLFTDASALDSGLVNSVIAKARDKDQVLNYALSGSCSPYDPAYIRGASETGGLLIPLANRSATEVTKLTSLFLAQLSGDLTRVASSKGTLAGATSQQFPIDATARRLVVLANADSLSDFKLRRPSGAVVAAGDPDTQITTILQGRIVIVNAPATGFWTVELAGSGEYAISVNANSPLELRRFAIVRPNADIHGGYFPLSGQPLAGSTVTGDATVLGPFASATFTAVDDSGASIKSLPLVQNFPDAAADHFLGSFQLPDVPFRVVAEGQDESGHPFRREFPALFTGQPANVQVAVGATDTLPAGTSRSFSVTITNAGAAANYGLQASSSVPGIGASISPGSVAIPGGGTATASLNLSVPAGTPDGTEVAVTIAATNTANSSIFNSATVRFVVAAITNLPPDTSAAAPTIATLWPVNHEMVAVGIEGVTDSDGDPVTVQITGISQSEPVNTAGDGNTCADSAGVGTATAMLRAERNGAGTGRIYVIEFTADDGKGGSTTGAVTVAVPKSASQAAVDSGLRFASGVCR
jgi:hypothetical protein